MAYKGSKNNKGNLYSIKEEKVARAIATLVFLFLYISSCNQTSKDTRFALIPSHQTRINFRNDLESKPDFNIINYLYFYDGGGVSIGDINNDNLPDLFFTANMLPNRLYINRGDFQFEDITAKAGVTGHGDWSTGTTMADVNGDGLLDIYVSNVHYKSKKGRNELFINNGDSTFTERAKEFGLDFSGYSKQATFFDYDVDGDLDMYLVNHANHSEGTYGKAELRKIKDSKSGDRLYRNDGDRFTNVTDQTGIYNSVIGYGLGVAVSDLNNDGCPDLYISNDFHENDYLYKNNCEGMFTETLESSTGHISRSSMGNDIADMNNDGRPDIYVADMLPMTEEGLKRAVSSESYKVYKIKREFGYHPQFIQNTLQVNLGESPEGKMAFAEIAKYAGIHATDWSWSTLFFDMDNSGQKDLFVTNGIYRRPNDLDYLLYVRRDANRKPSKGEKKRNPLEIIDSIPHTKVNNVGFINHGDFTFTDQSSSLGFEDPSYSNGAAYGDLDNDGDLDLVINNINSPASVYKNTTREKGGGNFLSVKLEGEGKNTFGIGAKVLIHDSSSVQLYEMFTTRGFQSSVEPEFTIGLGNSDKIDSLIIIWPDKQTQTLRDINVNQTLSLKQSKATTLYDYQKGKEKKPNPIFNNVTSNIRLEYSHREDAFLDYNRQQLAPFMLSSQGPRVATGDVNNDGLEDFFICGARNQAGKVFLQQENGKFVEKKVYELELDAAFEDVDAVLFDANGDEALDLFVVSGGNEYSVGSERLRDRLYLNDGKGNFVKISDSLPAVYENGSTVAIGDYDGDGDNDLFVGSRSEPQNYGVTPNSHLYENQSNGKFKDVTEQIVPPLKHVGMVTDASWIDINGDENLDLIVVGEWMPITIFLNKDGKLLDSTPNNGLDQTLGWWQSVKTGDFDSDGDVDLVAGNMGTNLYLKASQKEPIVMYLYDYNEDGQVDPIIGYTKNGKEYPVEPRDEFLMQFKFLRSKYITYRDYAGETIQEIFTGKISESDVKKKKVTMLNSVFVENKGDGRFIVKPLPERSQWAPIFAISSKDFNSDGHTDLLLGGNLHEVKPSFGGKYDASYGWYLEGRGGGAFEVIEMQRSGFFLRGEVRDIEEITLPSGQSLMLVGRNDQPLLFFKGNSQIENESKVFTNQK